MTVKATIKGHPCRVPDLCQTPPERAWFCANLLAVSNGQALQVVES